MQVLCYVTLIGKFCRSSPLSLGWNVQCYSIPPTTQNIEFHLSYVLRFMKYF